MKKPVFVAISFFFLSCAPDQPFPQGRLIDLSHIFDETTIFWPTERGFQLERGTAGYSDAGFFYSANRFCTAEHGGTHIDAPIHFYEGRNTIDQIPLDQLVGGGILLDVSSKCAADRNYQVLIEDFVEWETRHGEIPSGAIILIRTGFGSYWPDRIRYMGTDARGDTAVPKLHFPGLHPETARWLVSSRSIKAIGLDTPSIDYGQSRMFESHVTLFERNIPAFENVANLDQLPSEGFTVIALPMKIKGGSGAPLRIIAVVR